MSKAVQKQSIASIIILTLLMTANINWALSNDKHILIAILMGISVWFTYMSYLLLGKYPMLSILSQFSGQMLLVSADIAGGARAIDAVNNTGAIEMLSTISIIIFGVIFYKSNKKNDKDYKNKKIKDKILGIILYERKPISVPIWAAFCIWCMIVALVLNTMHGFDIDLFEGRDTYKLFAAAVMVMPTMVTLAINTTSDIAYTVLAVNGLVKVWSTYYLTKQGQMTGQNILVILIELVVVVIAIYFFLKNSTIKEIKFKKSEETMTKFEKSTIGIEYTEEELKEMEERVNSVS